jgi:ribonucleotide reductase beta subunit family protein with ferritin-like domain
MARAGEGLDATATATGSPGGAQLAEVTYTDLYARWERGNWCATTIDFSRDRVDWQETFTDTERRAALWNYAMFLHGEDAVAASLSPYIDAAPREELKYFLATQQVDEARHAVFFGRFMEEVVQTGDSFADAMAATRGELTWGFRMIFEELDKMAATLRSEPSKANFARGIMLYHLVVEATLAQPGQQFIERSLEGRGILPGFLEGMRNVSLDEHRHIGFGVKMLSELIQDPECRAAALETFAEVMPYSIAVYVPPNWDRQYVECFGFTLEEMYAEAERSVTTKLRTTGFTDDEINAPLQIRPGIPREERVRQILTLLEAGVLGEKTGPPRADSEVLATFFQVMEGALDPSAAPREPLTIQWDFADAEPWFVRIENGSTRSEPGRAGSPDLTFRCRFEDWADMAAGREDPGTQFRRRRIRASNPLTLWRCRNLFAT